MLQAQEDSGRRQESQPSVISLLKDFVDNAVLQVMVQMFGIEPSQTSENATLGPTQTSVMHSWMGPQQQHWLASQHCAIRLLFENCCGKPHTRPRYLQPVTISMWNNGGAELAIVGLSMYHLSKKKCLFNIVLKTRCEFRFIYCWVQMFCPIWPMF